MDVISTKNALLVFDLCYLIFICFDMVEKFVFEMLSFLINSIIEH